MSLSCFPTKEIRQIAFVPRAAIPRMKPCLKPTRMNHPALTIRTNCSTERQALPFEHAFASRTVQNQRESDRGNLMRVFFLEMMMDTLIRIACAPHQ